MVFNRVFDRIIERVLECASTLLRRAGVRAVASVPVTMIREEWKRIYIESHHRIGGHIRIDSVVR